MSYIYRYLQSNLSRKIGDFSVLLITGPRRAGKSTLAKKLLHEWGGGSYQSFDTPEEQWVLKNDPQLFVQNLKLPAVLDEIQNVPEIFPYLKSLVDSHPSSEIRLILTGSQSFSMMRNVNESLAGRILIKELLPFTATEALQIDVQEVKANFLSLLKGEELTRLTTTGSPCSVDHAILSGGYPSVWNLSGSEHRNDWYDSYCQTYVERDVRQLVNIKDLALYQKFISLAAHRSAKLINYSELGKDISVSYKTSKNYLSILEASYLWTGLPAYEKKIEARLVKASKGIFIDSGLCSYLNGISDEQALSRFANRDFLFETWCIAELLKLAKTFQKTLKFYHYRRSNSFEVDCVLELAGKLIPIEIKNSAKISKDWAAGIGDFARQTKDAYSGYGYVISRYDQAVEIAPNVKNIPISYLTSCA